MAPQEPGLYAWYAQIALSEGDWRPRLSADGHDIAGNYLVDALRDYVGFHQESSLALRAATSYDLSWSGLLRKRSISDPDEVTGDSIMSTYLGSIAGHAGERQFLIEVLKSAPPIFASPLYIGVASNLRERLSQHKKSYEEARVALRNQPGAASRLQFSGKDFGTRIAGAGIPLERLDCWVITAPTGDDDACGNSGQVSVRKRTVLEAAEWLLHRVFQPVMGRR